VVREEEMPRLQSFVTACDEMEVKGDGVS